MERRNVWVQWRLAAALAITVGYAAPAQAQTTALLGEWESQAGAVVQVYGCGATGAIALCVKILRVEPHGGSADTKNPDPALRGRSLCGVTVGTGFHAGSDHEATGGQLYDPNSGKTYTGSMRTDGGLLKLRGAWGPFFRTETMKRFSGNVGGCEG